MKSKQILSKILVISMALITSVAVATNVHAEGENTFSGCKDTPVEFSIRNPISSLQDRVFTFECSDNCGVKSAYQGDSWQLTPGFSGYIKSYTLTFSTPGEHNVSVYQDGVLAENLSSKFVIQENHSYGEAEIVANATCTTDGVKRYTCSNCKNSHEETIQATGHNYTVTTQSPTCTKNGLKTYTCSNCQDTYAETILAIGHNYTKTKESDATCIKPGSKTYVCSNCNESRVDSIPATGHSYSKWRITKKATIFNKGSKTRTCTTCKSVDKQDIGKLKSRVSLSKTKLNLKLGNKYSLNIKKKTKGDKVASWDSSKDKVVSINKKTGKIKALKNGTAVITLKMKSGCIAKCTVRVGVKKNKSGNRNPNQSNVIG